MPELSLPALSSPPTTPAQAPASRPRRQHGFTLAELAVVLVILALLSGSLLVPLGSRMEARDRQLTLERANMNTSSRTVPAIISSTAPVSFFVASFPDEQANTVKLSTSARRLIF